MSLELSAMRLTILIFIQIIVFTEEKKELIGAICPFVEYFGLNEE